MKNATEVKTATDTAAEHIKLANLQQPPNTRSSTNNTRNTPEVNPQKKEPHSTLATSVQLQPKKISYNSSDLRQQNT